MTVTTTGPINVAQILNALAGDGSLSVQGNPAAAGALLSSDQFTDTQITDALRGVTYDPDFGKPAEDKQMGALRSKAQAVFAGTDTFTPAQVQKILAAIVLRTSR